ncbi:efflux RND transporter periplasmic adaptor subunit [Desulfococcus sp.]|uniref:efflux RND transporter periplasmic adaptor subunit n=1 Tax=Desulfococcus sp. TaxID=2025834 RepID=UPI0035935EBF
MKTTEHEQNRAESAGGRPGRRGLRLVIPLAILIAGAAGAVYLNRTGPKPQKRAPDPIVALVETMTLKRAAEQVVVQAMGTVLPAREMTLKSRVAGEVIRHHAEFSEGGLLKTGDEVMRIDPEDYELAVRQKQSQVANAVYGLKLEEGYQEVARREWDLLGGGGEAKASDAELALRKPHLRKARADLRAAEAELTQARLNLARTRIHSPFNAVVRSRAVAIGSQIMPQDTLGQLVGTDAYWIQASVPVDRLSWIDVPRRTGEAGAPVLIRYGGGQWTREGRVIKLLSDLEPGGRMARILIEIQDPLDLASDAAAARGGRPPLLIGEYVLMDIRGAEVADVFPIPRQALRDDDHVWIAKPDGILAVRRVTPVWRGSETVFISHGLAEGERLIVSALAAPVEGMPVRLVSDEKKPAPWRSGTSRSD